MTSIFQDGASEAQRRKPSFMVRSCLKLCVLRQHRQRRSSGLHGRRTRRQRDQSHRRDVPVGRPQRGAVVRIRDGDARARAGDPSSPSAVARYQELDVRRYCSRLTQPWWRVERPLRVTSLFLVMAEAVEELWSGARSGSGSGRAERCLRRLSRSAEAVGGLSRRLRWVSWHWSGCHGLWRRPRGVHCQAFEVLDGGGEQELVPGAAEAAQSEAHQRVNMLGLAKQGFDLLPCGA